ncbi:MAG: hypothetical protein AAF208_07280 [Cyanobacteria bacterium P01_A01_bin.45]
MEVKGENYNVWYDNDSNYVNFSGTLRLTGMKDYTPILDLLNNIAEKQSGKITLNLQQLEFLNSSGISMLSKFIIGMRKKKSSEMTILASYNIPWQGKSLKNLQRLMPSLKLEIE